MFGSPETTTGGNALKFYASVRMDIRRIGAVKNGDEIIGNQTRVKVIKNKMAPPFRQAEFEITYGEGTNHLAEVIDLGVEVGAVGKAGSWYSYGDEKIGQGKANSVIFLKENPAIEATIRAEKLGVPNEDKEPADDKTGKAAKADKELDAVPVQ